MKKLKIYLDTSVISHLQADDVPEKMTITNDLWTQKYKLEGIEHVYRKWCFRNS